MNSIFTLVLALSVGAAPAAEPDDSEDIRVLVSRGSHPLSLHGTDLQLSDGTKSIAVGTAASIACRGDKATETPGSLSAELLTLHSSESIQVEGYALRGSLEIRCASGHWTAIDVLPLEEYLTAMLGSEMPPSFPLEALKAQAVAARSYAMHRKIEAEQEGLAYHLGATTLSQVYRGIAAEDARTRSAVQATRGEILAFGMLPVEAYFHSSCGGRTETGAAALGRNLPYLVSVSCPDPERSPQAHWSVLVTAKELARLIPQLNDVEPTDVSISSRSSTGRAAKIRLSSTHGSKTMPATQFRAALGYTRLPSLWFEVREAAGGFLFEGRGAGHGAGLCQWGANVLAQRGEGYREILSHYYPGTEIRRIY